MASESQRHHRQQTAAQRGWSKLTSPSKRLPTIEEANQRATCKQCLKAGVCAILRNQIALSKQFPQPPAKGADENAEPVPIFDPFAIALTCVEFFPPDVRLFKGGSLIASDEAESLR